MESGVLSKKRLDVADDLAGPLLDPVLAETLVDPLKLVVAHLRHSSAPEGIATRAAWPTPFGERRMGGTVSQQPEPTPEEKEAPLERLEEEEAQRYPGHEDPGETIEPDPSTP